MVFLARGRVAWTARVGAASLASLTALASACYISNEGKSPPLDAFYFPTALVVSPGRTALYAANSDFDIQYNGGTVLALDLRAIRQPLGTLLAGLTAGLGTAACSAVDVAGVGRLGPNPEPLLNPGPCSPIPTAPFVRGRAVIGAFASGAALVSSPTDAQARLFVTVRGDPSVTYFDIPDDRDPTAIASPCFGEVCLACGQDSDTDRCDAAHRIGDSARSNQRGLALPPEPVGIAASDDGQSLVVAQQTEASVSLVVNPFQGVPSLDFVLPNLPLGPTEVASVPTPRLVREASAAGAPVAYDPGFLVTFAAASEVDLVRAQPDNGASPPRPFLTRAAAVGISTNASGSDSRGLVVDASQRKACEEGCASGGTDCLADCAAIPLRLFIANRGPASLLTGALDTTVVRTGDRITGAYDTMRIFDQVALTQGPSKVALGEIIDPAGNRQPRVFVTSFDSRTVFALDPETGRVDLTIHTGRGPQSLAFDVGDDGDGLHAYLYVGHFTDSYVGVVDLDARNYKTFGSMFATLGIPVAPRDSK
jgi:DNA-binding beta-propeller fold protein YncE